MTDEHRLNIFFQNERAKQFYIPGIYSQLWAPKHYSFRDISIIDYWFFLAYILWIIRFCFFIAWIASMTKITENMNNDWATSCFSAPPVVPKEHILYCYHCRCSRCSWILRFLWFASGLPWQWVDLTWGRLTGMEGIGKVGLGVREVGWGDGGWRVRGRWVGPGTSPREIAHFLDLSQSVGTLLGSNVLG